MSLSQGLLSFQLTVFRETFFMILLQFQLENVFLSTSEQAKFCLFLGICWCSCFTYRYNFISSCFETVAKREAILNPFSKQWIFRDMGANQSARKFLSSDVVDTKYRQPYDKSIPRGNPLFGLNGFVAPERGLQFHYYLSFCTGSRQKSEKAGDECLNVQYQQLFCTVRFLIVNILLLKNCSAYLRVGRRVSGRIIPLAS